MVAEKRGVPLTEQDRQAVASGMRTLPPHPEVADSLMRLRDEGFRLATLTNSVQDVAEAQIENAGLSPLFEQVLSADTAGRLKPAPEPYRMAAQRLDIPLTEVRLVAAHAWDVTGAIRAGCRAAFVARLGAVLDPTGETPDIIGADLREVADAIMAGEP
jgi:2-haloacid dehalogenase